MSKKTQLEKIRRHLMRGKSITPSMVASSKPYALYRNDQDWLKQHREEAKE